MKSIANQYRDLKEGRMSQQNFMRNLRMTMPQYVTNVTSFNDAVRILKNKSILTETVIKEELDTKKVYGGTGQNQGDTGSSLQFTVIEDNPEYFEIDFTLSPNSKYRQAGAGSRSPREKEYGYVKVKKADFDGYITAKGENFYIGKDFITANLQTNKDNEVKPSEDELDAVIKRMEDEKAGEEAVKAQYDEELNEAKKKEEKNYNIQQANPTELRLGIRTELEHGDMELDKAKEIAYKNIAKDPIYYTKLKLSGVEAHPKKVKGEKEVPTKKKKEAIQLVDLVNGMQKVKMPKADDKKKLKEARFNVIGEPNEVAKQVMQFIDGNATLRALSDDLEIQQTSDPNEALLRFQYWDALPGEAIEKLKLQFKVESDSDFDEDTGNIIFYRLTPLRRNYGGKDLGASFEKFKSSLEEIIREVVDETFDGRDNLINPLSAEDENN